jgi:hypothetical protein
MPWLGEKITDMNWKRYFLYRWWGSLLQIPLKSICPGATNQGQQTTMDIINGALVIETLFGL